MRSAVTKVTIRKEGGFDRESIQAFYDNVSEKIDRPSAERFKGVLLQAGAILRNRVRATAPYDPEGKGMYEKTHLHLRDAVYIMAGPKDRPYVLVGVSHKKAPQGYWIEYGTSRMSAKPFFRPAQQATKQDMGTVIANGMIQIVNTKA